MGNRYLCSAGGLIPTPATVKVNKRKTAFKPLLLIFIVLFSVCLLGKLFFFKKTFFIVSSASMAPEYPVNTIVIAKKTPFKSISAGQVIIYKSDALNGGLALHRVTRITENGVYTKGDMNDFEDNQLIVEENYVATGVYKSYALGRFISAIRNPLGFIVFLVFPCLSAVVLFHIIKLAKKTQKNPYEKY